MRTAIVYCSQTGHTEKYARWLAEDLECPVYPYRERARIDLESIDLLVFCSWFHAATVIGSKWFKRAMAEHSGVRFVLLATGATPMPGGGWSEEKDIEEAFERSFPKADYPGLPRFYCHGGFDFDKLGVADKVMMRMFFRMNEKRADDPKVEEMLDTMRQSFDGTRREYLEPVIDCIRSLQNEGPDE
ncbi:MAG: flavodoxin family protein [Adlercreutzia sp.]|nr:flavodoxin family protein [Adlercreutzia sp.]